MNSILWRDGFLLLSSVNQKFHKAPTTLKQHPRDTQETFASICAGGEALEKCRGVAEDSTRPKQRAHPPDSLVRRQDFKNVESSLRERLPDRVVFERERVVSILFVFLQCLMQIRYPDICEVLFINLF